MRRPILYALGVPKRSLMRDIIGEIINIIMVLVIIIAATVIVMHWDKPVNWQDRVEQASAEGRR